MGMPKEPIICIFTMLQNMEYQIHTIYGDSELNFTRKLWAIPIQGIGQGNSAGPQIWAVVSTPMLDQLQAEGYGVVFLTSITNQHIHFVAYNVVDDCDIPSSHSGTLSYLEVITDLQGSIDMWQQSLHVTGSALVPSKSHWFLIDFKW
jgi:hypothetical protein